MTTLRGTVFQTTAISTNGQKHYIWRAAARKPSLHNKRSGKLSSALQEMLQTGTTTFNDMYNPNGVEIGQIHEVVARSKMRCYFHRLYLAPI